MCGWGLEDSLSFWWRFGPLRRRGGAALQAKGNKKATQKFLLCGRKRGRGRIERGICELSSRIRGGQVGDIFVCWRYPIAWFSTFLGQIIGPVSLLILSLSLFSLWATYATLLYKIELLVITTTNFVPFYSSCVSFRTILHTWVATSCSTLSSLLITPSSLQR